MIYLHLLISNPGADFCVPLDSLPNYDGAVSSTLNGLTCQRWDSQTPHKHHYTDPSLFPEATLEDAANYCRTPDGSEWPWCFTTSPEVRSQLCYFDVKLCSPGGLESGMYMYWLLIYKALAFFFTISKKIQLFQISLIHVMFVTLNSILPNAPQVFVAEKGQVHLFMQEHEKRKPWRVIILSKYQLTMMYTNCWLSLSHWDESILLSYHICIKSQQ